MSASAHAKASQKYGSKLSLERGSYGPRISIPTSGAERVGRFQERSKFSTARAADDADFASNSTAAASKPNYRAPNCASGQTRAYLSANQKYQSAAGPPRRLVARTQNKTPVIQSSASLQTKPYVERMRPAREGRPPAPPAPPAPQSGAVRTRQTARSGKRIK
ncbi:hypothetical protein EVAR_69323_1 [Eumeta japonica]|uniref:Uncharacterized protein n=1 Tax=Eumeta variegata TaxID=151549 RepID=A0A4C2A4E4_EUMVA|nr:hypothetical protein EVAR_69323_1 [Eumeta japonica]